MNQLPPKSVVRRLLELIRFSHTVFALPFALLACVWACVVPLPAVETPKHDSTQATATVTVTVTVGDGKPAGLSGGQLSRGQIALRVLGVLLCMVSARSAAMAFNRLVDARFDSGNPRTAARHLVTGELTRGQAWGFFVAMVLMFFLSCTLFLPNWLPLAGALPVLLWICGYSLVKRFTSAVHIWLGVALALSPICAWIAMRGEVVMVAPSDVWPAVGLAVAIACWVAGFDIIYACQDAAFDRQAGLYSLPARLGVVGALRVAAGLHGLMLVVLAALPSLFPQLSLGVIYWTGLAIVAGLVIRQHAIIRVREAEMMMVEELSVREDAGGEGDVVGEKVRVGEQSDAERRATLKPAELNLGRINEAFFQINALLSFCLAIVAAVDAAWR
ncbi:MAG: 4-hydroxybenzoate octaprenyltransferase [Aureliella sp.]